MASVLAGDFGLWTSGISDSVLVLRRPIEDVGVDTRTGVDDNDYQPPFRFTGKIDKLTVKLVALTATEENLLKQKAQKAMSARQ